MHYLIFVHSLGSNSDPNVSSAAFSITTTEEKEDEDAAVVVLLPPLGWRCCRWAGIEKDMNDLD